jgi:outer membrane biosynthesis protein TonB
MTLAMPYRDDSRTTLAFSLAVVLHVLLGLAVVGFFLFKPAPEPMQSKVFELVAAPPSDSPTDQQAAPGPPNFSLPKLTAPSNPSPPQPAEPTPAPPMPTPAPAVAKPSPKPAPTLTHSAPVVPKPTANQTPQIGYQQFLKEHHLTNPPASPQATGRPVPRVGVNIGSIEKDLQTAANGANGPTRGRANVTTSAEAQDYLDKLIARLQEAFVPPGGVSGLSAEIFLEIGPNGELVKKYLSHSSGNAVFDEAVKAALQSLTNVDPPPGGGQVHYTFTFTPSP